MLNFAEQTGSGAVMLVWSFPLWAVLNNYCFILRYLCTADYSTVPILVPGTSLAVLVRIRSKIAYGQTVVGCSHVASSTKRTYFHRYSSVPLVLVSTGKPSHRMSKI
jgi:hypothetical protein